MIKIAIVDDDKKLTSKVEEIVRIACKEQSIEYEINVFFDGKTLVQAIDNGSEYDLLFLDIEMENVDGITAAQSIRKIDEKSLIIYISGYEERIKDLFDVKPFAFISKPINEKDLIECCYRAFNRIKKDNELFYFKYKSQKQEKKVLLKDIVYFESNLRQIIIHLKDGTIEKCYGSLNGIEKKIKASNSNLFIRIHQSFLVNYMYVSKMTYSDIELKFKGESVALVISKARKSFVRRKLCEIAGEDDVVL